MHTPLVRLAGPRAVGHLGRLSFATKHARPPGRYGNLASDRRVGCRVKGYDRGETNPVDCVRMVHFMRNVLCVVPKGTQQMVAATIRTVFVQPDPATAREQWRRVADQLRSRFPRVAQLLDKAEDEVLAYLSFPKEHWRQVWSNNLQDRLNKEVKRRTDAVGIFPNDRAVVRLVGAILAEQNDEWQVARRYFSAESLAKLRTQTIFEPLPTPDLVEVA